MWSLCLRLPQGPEEKGPGGGGEIHSREARWGIVPPFPPIGVGGIPPDGPHHQGSSVGLSPGALGSITSHLDYRFLPIFRTFLGDLVGILVMVEFYCVLVVR